MITTVGDLREIIKDIPDDADLTIYDEDIFNKFIIEKVYASETELRIIL